MHKNNCERIKNLLEDIFKQKNIKIEIKIIDKYARGMGFWRMRIKVDENYKHLLDHIYSTAYSICALDGEYLDNKKIKRGFLYLS